MNGKTFILVLILLLILFFFFAPITAAVMGTEGPPANPDLSRASNQGGASISIFGSKSGDHVNKGDLYTIDQLRPRVVFLMHGGGREDIYRAFADEAKDLGVGAEIVYVRKGETGSFWGRAD